MQLHIIRDAVTDARDAAKFLGNGDIKNIREVRDAD